jgi:hypothetical protein
VENIPRNNKIFVNLASEMMLRASVGNQIRRKGETNAKNFSENI